MATLAFNREEIAARELKPELLEMDGISRASVEAHYKLYQGYVAKRNEILARLGEVDLGAANQVYSELRALKDKQYRWIDRKWDLVFWVTAAFVVGAAADITKQLFAGDWDFWTDWKDRQWWPIITPFAIIIIGSAL